ncbi:MAG: HAD family hydrolase [Thermoanaerobaculum sp.]
MTAIRAVACDVFGTLVHVPDPWFRRLAPEMLGVPPRAWLAAVRSVGLRQAYPSVEELVVALAAAVGVSQPQRQELLAEAVRKQLAQAKLVPGALSSLRFLRRRGLKLALISNLSSAHAQVIKDLSLEELFDVQLFSCELGATKPAPEVFLRLCQELALAPSQILVVGDSEASDGAARRLGFPVLLVGSQRLPHFFLLGWFSWESSDLRSLLREGQQLVLGKKA